jgi:hypothetical protein
VGNCSWLQCAIVFLLGGGVPVEIE